MNAPSASFARNDDGRMSLPLSSIVCSKFPTNRAIAHLFSVRCSCLWRRRLSISRELLSSPELSLVLHCAPPYSPYLQIGKDLFHGECKRTHVRRESQARQTGRLSMTFHPGWRTNAGFWNLCTYGKQPMTASAMTPGAPSGRTVSFSSADSSVRRRSVRASTSTRRSGSHTRYAIVCSRTQSRVRR